MNRKRLLPQMIGLALLLLLLVSCGTPRPTPTPTPVPPTPTRTPVPPTPTRTPVPPTPTRTPLPPPISPEFPTGTFVHEKYPRYYAVQFNEDGTWLYFVVNFEVPEVEGTYRIDGDLYTDTSVTDPKCPTELLTAPYRWTYDGQNLTFQVVGEDKCVGRKRAYDGQTYIKSQ